MNQPFPSYSPLRDPACWRGRCSSRSWRSSLRLANGDHPEPGVRTRPSRRAICGGGVDGILAAHRDRPRDLRCAGARVRALRPGYVLAKDRIDSWNARHHSDVRRNRLPDLQQDRPRAARKQRRSHDPRPDPAPHRRGFARPPGNHSGVAASPPRSRWRLRDSAESRARKSRLIYVRLRDRIAGNTGRIAPPYGSPGGLATATPKFGLRKRLFGPDTSAAALDDPRRYPCPTPARLRVL